MSTRSLIAALHRSRSPGRLVTALAVTASVVLPVAGVVAAGAPVAAAAGYPTAPTARICGNAAVLDGPVSPPAGSVRVDPGRSLQTETQARSPGTTFWLAPGVHTLSNDQFDQVVPKTGNIYVGAPGAVLDGRSVNRYAFSQGGERVTIRNLTVRGFVAPHNEGVVNHDLRPGWLVERNTISDNRGAGVMVASDNVLRENCVVRNGQYGYSAVAHEKARNVTIDRNEIAQNNVDNWEALIPGCGCSGAGKMWETTGAAITNNWVHDNRGSGIWADTNNAGVNIEGNYIENNDGEGIFYEISYNARIVGNTLRRNALVKGRDFAARGSSFPVGAIYISESGGDARVDGGRYATLEIANNYLQDNWDGVVLWEDADRYCGSPSTGSYCTRVATSLTACSWSTITLPPNYSDCRWKTQNVSVHDNELRIDKAAMGCIGTLCGTQALISSAGSSWSPYQGRAVQDAVTYEQGNRFSNNTYVGDWRFLPWEPGNVKSFYSWKAVPYNQDAGSTLNGALVQFNANALNADTSGLEGSAGTWVPWFSTAVSSSAAQAHSGSRSLEVRLVASYGWGITQSNWPGFNADPGPKTISFWGRAGSGIGLGATMSVHWRTDTGALIRTDSASLPLMGSTWAQASADVVAPEGTTKVAVDFRNGIGLTGDVLYLDDIVVGDRGTAPIATTTAPTTTTVPLTATTVPPTTTTTTPTTTTTTVATTTGRNALDAGSSGFEGTAGYWASWFQSTIWSSTAQARTGTHSLQVRIDAPYGWGVTQTNWPGFAAGPGPKTIGFWGRAGSGDVGATMSVHWRTDSGVLIRTDWVSLPSLSSTWAQARADVVAPPGTARVAVDFTNSRGVAGNTLYLDDIVVAG